MAQDKLDRGLWTPRSVEETRALYRDWAARYDADVTGSGYHTPARLAEALAAHLDRAAAILDFGCGTGLGGAALAAAGFTVIDGTDVTAEMLDLARDKGFYRRLWLSEPGENDFETGAYRAIFASGVISLGAAPPATLAALMAKLAPGGILALSYNDPTLAAPDYIAALAAEVAAGNRILFRAHGPHLAGKNMGSDVILIERSRPSR